jgi:hypothetical protein
MSNPEFTHIVNLWLCAGYRDTPIHKYLAANRVQTLQGLHGFLQKPSTIKQLTCVDQPRRPSHRFGYKLTEEDKESLIGLPYVLAAVCGSYPKDTASWDEPDWKAVHQHDGPGCYDVLLGDH